MCYDINRATKYKFSTLEMSWRRKNITLVFVESGKEL